MCSNKYNFQGWREGKSRGAGEVLSSQVPQPTCYWKWVRVTMPLKAGNFSLQPSRTENSGRAWPVGCLLDFWTSHEDTCTISFLSTHWFCRQHSSSILLQIATSSSSRSQLLLKGSSSVFVELSFQISSVPFYLTSQLSSFGGILI